MRFLLIILLCFPVLNVVSQEMTEPNFTAVDSLYREDQFYLSFSYNILQNRPEGVSQNKFSAGFSAGFLRDMPINETRTIAIAAGIGYSLNNYNQNLMISESNGNPEYSLIDPETIYNKNNFSLHYLDLPIEFRWRTSTPESHKFWRIYTGVKLSYLLYSRSKFSGNEQKIIITKNEDFNKFQYGVYLAGGYNTWNFHLYYGLNPLFKSAELNGNSIDMRTLNIGLMFYIL